MGKITKSMQKKHRDTLTPWLQNWVAEGAKLPPPQLLEYLATFPLPWTFPRDDLYHFIPLLNRFDTIIDLFCSTYGLSQGPQIRDYACDVLLMSESVDDTPWTIEKLAALGYSEQGDKQLILLVLRFTKLLLENCGNRSIYASSSHLSSLLNASDLEVVAATLQVSLEVAKRYHASVRRTSANARQLLLSTHYNINLDRVDMLALPFVKTPLAQQRNHDSNAVTPGSKGKDKAPAVASGNKSAATSHLHAISSLVFQSKKWSGWGDIRVSYVPQSSLEIDEKPRSTGPSSSDNRISNTNSPSTPTPLRRSSTIGSSASPRGSRPAVGDSSNSTKASRPHQYEVAESVLQRSSIHLLLQQLPGDLPDKSQFECLHRLRIAKALLGSPRDREFALATRLLAIANLAYVYPDASFIEKALPYDHDQPRHLQVVYQLAELLRPSTRGLPAIPMWLQTIVLTTFDTLMDITSHHLDIATALNASTTHGVLLYLFRQAINKMRDANEPHDVLDYEFDAWRKVLFSLTQMVISTISSESIAINVLDLLLEVLRIRSHLADRILHDTMEFLDNVLSGWSDTFPHFCESGGLDLLTSALAREVAYAQAHKAPPDRRSPITEYEVSYQQQHNIKWILKVLVRALSNLYLFGSHNVERRLRNLLDDANLLGSLRSIILDIKAFGPAIWASAASALDSLLNNDPAGAGVLIEAGLITAFLTSVTGDASIATPSVQSQAGQPGTVGDNGELTTDQANPPPVVSSSDGAQHQPVPGFLDRARELSLHERPAAQLKAAVEVVNIVPNILDSISLNRVCLQCVKDSQAIPKYLEIFEAPDHIRILARDPADPARSIGVSFDDFSRHHPSLADDISTAILETAARIVKLGCVKAETDGWGARFVPDELVSHPQLTLNETASVPNVNPSDNRAITEDIEVDLTTATQRPPQPIPGNSQTTETAAPVDFLTYATVFLSFIDTYLQNDASKQRFAARGGIELLLDLIESPAFPPHVLDSGNSVLKSVIVRLVAAYPIRAVPSLLNRILKSIQDLSCLADTPTGQSYFGPLLSERPDVDSTVDLGAANKTLRAFVRMQLLMTILGGCFRQHNRNGDFTALPPVNVYEMYVQVIQNLMPITRVLLEEDRNLFDYVNKSRTDKKQPESGQDSQKVADDSIPLSADLTEAGFTPAESASNPIPAPNASNKTNLLRNHQLIRSLLKDAVPKLLPILQAFGKAIFPRRNPHPDLPGFHRPRHRDILEALTRYALSQMNIPEDDETIINNYPILSNSTRIICDLLIHKTPSTDNPAISLPLLVFFKEYGGFAKMNDLIRMHMRFLGDQDQNGKVNAMKTFAHASITQILQVYTMVVQSRLLGEACEYYSLVGTRAVERRPDQAMIPQLVLEIRMAIWPVLVELWDSKVLESAPPDLIHKLVHIFQAIARKDEESRAAPSGRDIINQFVNPKPKDFDWGFFSSKLESFRSTFPEDLAREGIYRALNAAHEYCEFQQAGLMGDRNPIPHSDLPTSEPPSEKPPARVSPHVVYDAMDVDDDTSTSNSVDAHTLERQPDAESLPATVLAASPASAANLSANEHAHASISVVTKEDMDNKRAEFRKSLVERCLEILQAQPSTARDLTNILIALLDRCPESERQETVDTVLNALLSFLMDDDLKSRAESITAYAHLLSLLLVDPSGVQRSFLPSTYQFLVDNVAGLLDFVKIPLRTGPDEPAPWLPHVFFIFEIALRADEVPCEVSWTKPAANATTVKEPIVKVKERIVNGELRSELLNAVLELLPRIGRDQLLSTVALRLLVILTRDRAMATTVGEKRNLQRIFVLTKQLASLGASVLNTTRVTALVMTILRHVVEDEATVKQLIRAEINQYFCRSSPPPEIATLLHSLHHAVLRSPDLFVEVANDMLKLDPEFQPFAFNNRHVVVLKNPLISKANENESHMESKDTSGKATASTASRPTGEPSAEDSSLRENSLKPTTECDDVDMMDFAKTDPKRPLIDNPDGVIHFLLSELLNYRDVDDQDLSAHKELKALAAGPASDNKDAVVDAGSSQISSPEANSTKCEVDHKDKHNSKPVKPIFKTEEHPIFVYRCFLLNCIAELVRSYTKAKVEFINFKRSTPNPVNNVPLPAKPRSGALNYLMNDLLFTGIVNDSPETIADKKKVATALHAQRVIVYLALRTGEDPVLKWPSSNPYELDDNPSLLFVRKFVLDSVLKATRDCLSSIESHESRAGRLLCCAELLKYMMGERETNEKAPDANTDKSWCQLRRLMYERGYVAALTQIMADIDPLRLCYKKAIKEILKNLATLTETGVQLSHLNILPASTPAEIDETSSVSDSELDNMREETPDLYRNSALGMMEPDAEADYSGDSEEEDDEMYEDEEYDDEMGYDDGPSHDDEDNISDEEDAFAADMEDMEAEDGPFIEMVVDDDEDMDEDMDDTMDDDMDMEDDMEDGEDLHDPDDDEDEEELEDYGEGFLHENQLEIFDEDGNMIEDDGASGWESAGDGADAEAMGGDAIENDDEGDDADVADLMNYGAEEPHPSTVRPQFSGIMPMGHNQLVMEIGSFADHVRDDGVYDQADEEDGWEEDVDMEVDDELDGEEFSDYGEVHHPAHAVMPRWSVHRVSNGDRSLPPPHYHHVRRRRRPLTFERPRALAGFGISNADFWAGQSNPHTVDEGLHPLLQQNHPDSAAAPSYNLLHVPERIFEAFPNVLSEHPLAVLHGILETMPAALRNNHRTTVLAINNRGEIRASLSHGTHGRDVRIETSRRPDNLPTDPQQAVAFTPIITFHRWIEEARLLFGCNASLNQQTAERVMNLILAKLAPAALESARKAKEELELKRKMEREAELKAEEEKAEIERLAKEKQQKENEERERAMAAERATQQAEDQESNTVGEEDVPSGSQTGPAAPASAPASTSVAEGGAAPRVIATIRDRQIDITDLGIDLDYFQALPDEFREEVIAQTVTARRSAARQAGSSGTSGVEAYQEFLDVLPPDLRHDILHQERNEQRRRGEGGQLQSNFAGGIPEDMDPASILRTFPEDLRAQVLMEQGADLLDQLPPDMAAEARAFGAPFRRDPYERAPEPGRVPEQRPQHRPVAQMMESPGIACLIRLAFVRGEEFISPVINLLRNICRNHHCRLEVVRTLLYVLQDGSIDLEAVDRGYVALTCKARQIKESETASKTPQSASKQPASNSASVLASQDQPVWLQTEISPLVVVKNCLKILEGLGKRDVQHIAAIFVSEHDYGSIGLKRTTAKKGKGKEVAKTNKFAINALLALLDRDVVLQSGPVLQHLAEVLDNITIPMANRERRRLRANAISNMMQEELEMAARGPEAKQVTLAPLANNSSDSEDQEMLDVSGSAMARASEGNDGKGKAKTAGQSEATMLEELKKVAAAERKAMQLPLIPRHLLALVVKIFLARECSSKTFQHTISLIKNLSYIPGAKEIIGDELIKQANLLSSVIVEDLNQLLPAITEAQNGTEVQGIALYKFSPNTSDQNKLLRVLTALDHLFDSKGPDKKPEEQATQGTNSQQADLLGSLYRNSTFGLMWERLGACLSEMRERANTSAAIILLPLIESLMVVCKSSTSEESPAKALASAGEKVASSRIVESTPPPESPLSSLFFRFTEEHRRILNDLVRNSPRLMSGNLSVLVKNANVLDFDNKRNWFTRSIHQRNNRKQSTTLQVSVRRDQVFHDSFTSLFYKPADVLKYAKLSVRFQNEEGVDAGGVTREWFQVLSRQMFDPNYALFTPVSSDRTTFHPNKLSDINADHLKFFTFIGRIIGKALYERRLLDCYFSRAVYKRILGKHVSVKDMESFDPDYYKSLCWILDNNITDVIAETFSIDVDRFGVTTTEDLIANGRNIAVTEANKQDYVHRVVEHKLLSSVKEQMEAFLSGFHDIIPPDLISIFNEQELELLISGLPDVDIDDWKANTEYNNYTAASPQIQWFWRAVRSFDKEETAKLLQFVTGTSKVPLNGFKELEGMNGVNRFNIHRDPTSKDRLPSSHTCFNQLDLPEYESYEILRRQLVKAITAGNEYFGFA